MQVHIFLLCYNESVLIERTIEHYRKYLPNCIITIMDNESTDNSVAIAESRGCRIHSWSSENRVNDDKYLELKNHIWKSVSDGWIIVGDMDEWLCISESELQSEEEKGTTVLTTIGYNMVSNSNRPDLSDIDLHSLDKGIYWPYESKSLCFKCPEIQEMNYSIGAHSAYPTGRVQYSDRAYLNKHLEPLGLPYLIDKFIARYARCEYYRQRGDGSGPCHYTNDIQCISDRYHEHFDNAVSISHLL